MDLVVKRGIHNKAQAPAAALAIRHRVKIYMQCEPKRRGRPKVMGREVGKSVKVYLLPSIVERARVLGGGNLSLGLSRAIAVADIIAENGTRSAP